MISDQNKAAYRRYYEELFNKHNLAIIDELIDPNVVSHSPFPGQAPGAAGLKQALAGFFQAFPDLRAECYDIIAEADKVVARFIVTGTHQGEFMGIPASQKKMAYEEIVIVRFKEGKIVEHWAVADALAMLQQLGVIQL